MAPCENPDFMRLFKVIQAVDPEDAAYDVPLEQVASLSVVHQSWWDFLVFLKELRKDSLLKEESACVELSLHAQEPRWHFHVASLNIR